MLIKCCGCGAAMCKVVNTGVKCVSAWCASCFLFENYEFRVITRGLVLQAVAKPCAIRADATAPPAVVSTTRLPRCLAFAHARLRYTGCKRHTERMISFWIFIYEPRCPQNLVPPTGLRNSPPTLEAVQGQVPACSVLAGEPLQLEYGLKGVKQTY
jgi:hypothetical protein